MGVLIIVCRHLGYSMDILIIVWISWLLQWHLENGIVILIVVWIQSDVYTKYNICIYNIYIYNILYINIATETITAFAWSSGSTGRIDVAPVPHDCTTLCRMHWNSDIHHRIASSPKWRRSGRSCTSQSHFIFPFFFRRFFLYYQVNEVPWGLI